MPFLAVGVGVVLEVAAAEGVPVAVAAAGAGRQVLGGGDRQPVAAGGALVGTLSGGDVAASGDGISHEVILPVWSGPAGRGLNAASVVLAGLPSCWLGSL